MQVTASASRGRLLTRLNTRPARSPVNASSLPSRAAPHDSGPVWVANPAPCDSFIHYTSSVLTSAQGDEHGRDEESIGNLRTWFNPLGWRRFSGAKFIPIERR